MRFHNYMHLKLFYKQEIINISNRNTNGKRQDEVMIKV